MEHGRSKETLSDASCGTCWRCGGLLYDPLGDASRRNSPPGGARGARLVRSHGEAGQRQGRTYEIKI
eukprot:3062016-Pyramimonas_sp.AAC.1